MKRSRYTEEQIIVVVKESEAGMETAELCRKHGISQQTFYRWKARYGGLEVNEAQRFPHSHSHGGGELVSLLNSTPSTLTYPD